MTDSNIKNQIASIREIANSVDKKDNGGNGNKVVDGTEISVFIEKLEEKGFSNAKSIVSSYTSNTLYNETIFSQKGSSADDSEEMAIMAELNPKSFLNGNKNKSPNEVDDIVNGIHEAVNWGFWFITGTDYDILDKKIGLIDKNNVLAVLNADYPDKKVNIIDDLIDDIDSTQSDLDKYGHKIIDALVQNAQSKGIDVSSVITMDEKKKYTIIGTDVAGAKAGASVTDPKYLSKVIYALKDLIESTSEIMTDEAAAKKDLKKTMNLFALQADTNRNGILDENEIATFKIACANVGISVNEMLASIREKTSAKTNLTHDEKSLKTLFDSKINFRAEADKEFTIKNLAASISQGLSVKDENSLKTSLEQVNSDNVEEVLAVLDNNNIADKIHLTTSEKSKLFNHKILSALYSKAEKENINVADIVRESGDDFVIGFGDLGADALDSKYVNTVISKLRQRIKEESGD